MFTGEKPLGGKVARKSYIMVLLKIRPKVWVLLSSGNQVFFPQLINLLFDFGHIFDIISENLDLKSKSLIKTYLFNVNLKLLIKVIKLRMHQE